MLISRPPPWLPPSDDPPEAVEYHWSPSHAPDVYSPEAYAARAREMAQLGFTALKFDLDLPLAGHDDLHARTLARELIELQVSLARATCEAAAPNVDVAFDLHWRYAPSDALRLARELEDLGLLWLEDPTPPADLASVTELARRTTTPIATGENMYGLEQFTTLLDLGGVDIVAPDLQKVGGLAVAQRIAAIADVRSRPLAPHNISPHRHARAPSHLCASVPNFLALEWHAASVPFFDELIGLDRPLIEGGYIAVPEGRAWASSSTSTSAGGTRRRGAVLRTEAAA